MRKHSLAVENVPDQEFGKGSKNWLLHARYVRGEHSICQDLADELQKENDNKHKYAHFIKGMVLADAGRLQEALERFHSCLKLNPQDPEPLKQVAKCLFRQERYQLSLEAYLEADKITKHPDADIYCGLAECAYALGDTQRGVEWARSAVQGGGGERAGALLARLLLACDQHHAALAAYDQLLTSHTCGADTLAAAGTLQLKSGDPRRAFQLLGAALAQQPTQHAAALALAAMMLQHKDLDAALARLKAALTAHSTCVAAHNNLGLALIGKKKYVAALTCLQRAVWSAPLSGVASHNLGLALLVCRRPASAFTRLAASATLQPTHAYTVLLIAITLERLKDPRADSAYERAATLAPRDALVCLNLAARRARTGRLYEALRECTRTREIIDAQGKQDAQLASSLSTLLELLKEAGVQTSERQPALTEVATPEVTSKEDLNKDKMAADEV